MFALAFRFPANRYHATPWGRNVNEADVAWPPEPWRLLRAFVATWWRKGDCQRWSKEDLSRLIENLAESPPEYSLPTGTIHSHTRHYMPTGKANETKLVFDAFLRLPVGATLVAVWPRVVLEPELFAFAGHIARSMGYLGRAESWAECEALSEWDGKVNCRLSASTGEGHEGDTVRALAPLDAAAYADVRRRIMKNQSPATAKQKRTTLPERLVDALALDTADYQNARWSHPPAARQVVYVREADATPRVVARRSRRSQLSAAGGIEPTVARFLLAGRPRPRIEDTIKIGELMRRATLAQFGWQVDAASGRSVPKAPWEISGRDKDGRPLNDPRHAHAFWLPEDADGDGWIDHVSVFVSSGINGEVRVALDRVTRLWLPQKLQQEEHAGEPGGAVEWRLALEGFGKPTDFADSARIFDKSNRWQSVTPFLASGHLKRAGYLGEVRRLLERRGLDSTNVEVGEICEIDIAESPRRPTHFHRFRSRGREKQPDAGGAFLTIVLPQEIEGPLAIGYGSHFGLGLFAPAG